MAYNPLAQGELDAPDTLSESDYFQIAASPADDLDEIQDKRGRRSPNLDLQSPSSYSDAMDHPRTVSREGSVLRHPAPDLQSIQGAYWSNVERLERSAERLSLSTSGIGEEIRKMREEQRKSDSRHSSVLDSPIDDEHECSRSLSRKPSYGYGSHASNSIVGTNNIARSGGFSPAAYVASPRGSVRSGSWSQHTSVKERSASYGPRLTQLSEPEQEGKPLDSPISSRLVPIAPEPETPASPLRVVNHESLNLDDIEIPHTQSELTEAENEPEPRPSTDTYRQANGLFADFDGVHTENHADGPIEPQRMGNRRVSSQPRPANRIMSYIEPPPGENMVYYPAPVPMMLNLPKRLSKLPQAAEREKRRSELLGNLPKEARKSAAWLPDMYGGSDEGSQRGEAATHAEARKRRTMGAVPPQLRATMFFDQPTVHHDIELKGESAVETLDSILDASAFAPVSAFTDHPFVGHAGAGIYSKEVTKSRASIVPTPQKRRTTIHLLTKRTSSTDILDDAKRSPNVLRKRNSNPNLLDDTKRRNSSLLSLGNVGKRRSDAQPLEDGEEVQRSDVADDQGEEVPLQTPDDDVEIVAAEESYFHDAPEQPEEQGQDENEEQAADFTGAPSTLLAELQFRKAQQKLRNRTAATAFPDGMHSTLLQLDAVDQLQKQKRKQQHTRLAWEDPNVLHPGVENEDDEDVPLGVLFAGRQLDTAKKARRMDEERPLGLIAKRQLEDNEPLSHRRARLRGEDLRPRPASPEKRNSMYTLDLPNFGDNNLGSTPDEAPENENENETLGQRLRRLKATQIPVYTRPVSGDFASEMMSQFGAPSPSAQPPDTTAPRSTTKTPDAEETLGQRRKRLQAEAQKSRQASGDSSNAAPQPPLSKRRSMADILQAHPAAGAGTTTVRALSNEIKFAPAPKTRNTPWAINQTRQASMGAGVPMASGIGMASDVYGNGIGNGMNGHAGGGGMSPHPMVQKPVEVDNGRREMIDRWRQSVNY